MNLLKAIFFWSIIAWPVLSAQELRKLTVEEALQIGLENSKSLHASQMKAESASAKKSETNAARLPSLKLTAGYTRLSDVPPGQFSIPANAFAPGVPVTDVTSTLSPTILNTYTLKATVQQQLFTGFRLENNSKVAELSEKASRQDLEKDKTDMIYAIRLAYWNLFRATEVKKVVDENVDQVQAHLKDAQNLLAQGMITNNDVLKVQVQLSSVRLLQIDARNGVELSMINLNNLIGLPLGTQIEISSVITNDPMVFQEVSALIQKAADQRQDVKALEYRLQAGDASVKIAQAGYYPQASLTGNYYYNSPNTRYFPTRDQFKTGWDVGVTVNFDVWNWGATKYQTKQAQAQVAQVKDALGLLKDGISLEVTQNYLNLRKDKEKIEVAKQSIAEAEESYRITSEKFKRGVALTTDLLDAEVAVLRAKTDHTDALVEYELAEARLLKAIGEK
ncbi:TolC family protein [bacterium]|nr:MAG: TolC family protein [bacterium]